MATWQAFLIIIGALVVGSILGLVTIRLISRSKWNQDNYHQADRKSYVATISKKPVIPESTLEKPTPPELTSKQPISPELTSKNPIPSGLTSKQPIIPELALKKPSINSTKENPTREKLELILQERNKSMSSTQPPQNENADMLTELTYNLSIAAKQPNGKLLLFQTNCWDKNHSINEPLLNNYREELTQAYTDIHLANVIVWLSNDLGHTSLDLQQSYLQLCTKIATRLKYVISSQISAK
jgi:hypothetical protein